MLRGIQEIFVDFERIKVIMRREAEGDDDEVQLSVTMAW